MAHIEFTSTSRYRGWPNLHVKTEIIASNLLCVVNVHETLLHGPFLLVNAERSLSKFLGLDCLAIEHFGNLLKGAAFSFREEEVNCGDHCGKRANVDEVELPGDGFEGDRVAELVEN